MKNKICFIIISLLFFPPLTGLAVEQTIFSDVVLEDFDIIWSADTYTPIDYVGRALPVRGSKITVEAIVTILFGNTQNLKYSWFLDDVFQQSKSGYGKTSSYFYAYKGPGAKHVVRLQIFNEDRTIFEEKSIQIPITEPELVIYSSNGNSFFSKQASKISTITSNKTFSFVAKPYFFSINKLTDLVFEWTLEGQSPIRSSDYNASVLDLNITNKNTNEASKQNLLVNVKNSQAKEQGASKTIKINIY